MPTSLEDARKRIAAKMSQRKGTHGESVARLALERFGIKQVVRIETGWRIKRIGGRVVGAVGVSGAASAQQDDEIAIAGAAAALLVGTHVHAPRLGRVAPVPLPRSPPRLEERLGRHLDRIERLHRP